MGNKIDDLLVSSPAVMTLLTEAAKGCHPTEAWWALASFLVDIDVAQWGGDDDTRLELTKSGRRVLGAAD